MVFSEPHDFSDLIKGECPWQFGFPYEVNNFPSNLIKPLSHLLSHFIKLLVYISGCIAAPPQWVQSDTACGTLAHHFPVPVSSPKCCSSQPRLGCVLRDICRKAGALCLCAQTIFIRFRGTVSLRYHYMVCPFSPGIVSSHKRPSTYGYHLPWTLPLDSEIQTGLFLLF